MSRHRNVRSMNVDDEYYDEDDVYGHSVDDKYCISPSTAAQFTYNRDCGGLELASYLSEKRIPEEDESDEEGDSTVTHYSRQSSYTQQSQQSRLSDFDKARLSSCLDEIHNVLGDSISEGRLNDVILAHNFNVESALNELLSAQDQVASAAASRPLPYSAAKTTQVKPSSKTQVDNVNIRSQKHASSGLEMASKNSDHKVERKNTNKCGNISGDVKPQHSAAKYRNLGFSKRDNQNNHGNMTKLDDPGRNILKTHPNYQNKCENTTTVEIATDLNPNQPKTDHEKQVLSLSKLLSEMGKSDTTNIPNKSSTVKATNKRDVFVNRDSKSSLSKFADAKPTSSNLSSLSRLSNLQIKSPLSASSSGGVADSNTPGVGGVMAASRSQNKISSLEKLMAERSRGKPQTKTLSSLSKYATVKGENHSGVNQTKTDNEIGFNNSNSVTDGGERKATISLTNIMKKTSDVGSFKRNTGNSILDNVPCENNTKGNDDMLMDSVNSSTEFNDDLPYLDIPELLFISNDEKVDNYSFFDTVTPRMSGFGQSLCDKENTIKPNEMRDSLQYPNFSYQTQVGSRHVICDMNHLQVFDFGRPSPDDIVTEQQKAAFQQKSESRYRFNVP